MEKETIGVETIEILLGIGDKDDIAEAIRFIDANFKEKIVEIIRMRAFSANSDELFDIYQDVLFGLYNAAKEGKYDPDKKKLQGFIYKIATRKAIDWVRKKYAKKRKRDTGQDVLIDAVAETIKDSSISEAWQYAQQNELRSLILEKIRKIIPRLKTRQRQIAEIIYMNFPDFLSDSEIKDHILYYYGENITTLAVKSARQEVYSKVKEALSTTNCGDYVND